MREVAKGVTVSIAGFPRNEKYFIEVIGEISGVTCSQGDVDTDYEYGLVGVFVPVNKKEWEVVINYCNGTQKTIIFDNGEIKVEEV